MVIVMKKRPLLSTCLGLGKLPWAPATWASLPPVVMYQILGYLGPAWNTPVMAVFVVAGITIHLTCATAARETLPPAAHTQIVAHKLAGQGLTILIITILKPVEICNSMALGFFLFRLVDAGCTWLVRRRSAEESEPCPLLSSLCAGLIAGLVSAIIIGLFSECRINCLR